MPASPPRPSRYVINGTRFVSPELRERVLTAVAELDYRPNAVAQSLRQKKTRTIGLIVPDNSNPFFAEVAKGVEDAGYEAGVSVILCNSDGSFDRELRYLQTAARQAGRGRHLHRDDADAPTTSPVVVERAIPAVVFYRAGARTSTSTRSSSTTSAAATSPPAT